MSSLVASLALAVTALVIAALVVAHCLGDFERIRGVRRVNDLCRGVVALLVFLAPVPAWAGVMWFVEWRTEDTVNDLREQIERITTNTTTVP